MPKVSQDHLASRRGEILDGARRCFAAHGYEGATVRRLEEQIGLSRGAIFHHFHDKETLFLAVATDDAADMAAVVAEQGLVQVMRDMLRADSTTERAGWLSTQIEVSRRIRTDPDFARRWSRRSEAIGTATRARLQRQADAGVLRRDVPITVLQQLLELVHDGIVLHIGMGLPQDSLGAALDVIEESVRARRTDSSP